MGGNRAHLAQLEREIQQGKVAISQHEGALKQFDESLSGTKSEIDGYKVLLEQIEQESKAGLEVDRGRYDVLLALHNDAVERHNSTLALRRAKYAEYQTILRETNAKVDTYNRLIR
jgi:flagellar biosynthesis chaperone FliJ